MSERQRDKSRDGDGLSGQSSPRRPDSSARTTPAAAAGDKSSAPAAGEKAAAAAAGDDASQAADRDQPSPAEATQEEEEQVERDLSDMLADVERERDEYLGLARRTKADFENYRKRVAGEAREAEKRGSGKLMRELLPVLDNLDRALDAAGSPDAPESLADGVRLVREELAGVLKRSGIESYEPKGEEFDPHLHEAMMTRPVTSDDAGKVLEVLEKGYRLDGQVLRPARVIVGEEKQQPPAGKPGDESEPRPSGGKPPAGSQPG